MSVRDIDVCFMGRLTGGPRDELLSRVIAWGKASGHVVHVETDYQRGREAEIYRRSKIAWRYSQRGETPMGVYESMACGALAVLQHDAVEAWKTDAPIPTYSPGNVEDFLEHWLEDTTHREYMVAEQREWVARETPVAHLRWLLRQIEKRIDKGVGSDVFCNARGAAAGIPHPDRARPSSPANGHKQPQTLLTQREDDTDERASHRGVRGDRADAAAVPARDSDSPSPALAEPTQDEQRPEVCAHVPVSAQTVLDLGCGFGGVGWRLRQDHSVMRVYGVDASPTALATAIGRLDWVAEFDLNYPREAWEKQSWYTPGKYDCVILADILEHLVDPWHALTLIKPLLAPDGVVIASIPNLRNVANLYELVVNGDFRYFLHGKDEFRGPQDSVCSWAHLRFFTRKTIEDMFERAGLPIEFWHHSPLSAPELEGWNADLGNLVYRHKYPEDGTYLRDAYTLRYIVEARVA